jgi:ribosomal protein S18 acetylase RimI-like enzyme
MDGIIRRAHLADLKTLVDFALGEATEAEGIRVNREKVRKGIQAALEDESVAIYWVLQGSRDEIVGNVSVVKEWSNWKAGHYWWIQSLYIKPEHRGRGLMEALIQKVRESARKNKALDLRLYVHKNNARAIGAYRKSGFIDADYQIMRMDI